MGDQKDQLNEENLASHLPDAPAALSAEERADLVNTLKSKLQDLAGQNSDFLDTLSPIVKKRVDALREIQSQHDELEAKFLEEKAVLEANYQKLYEPLYTKRGDIINGVVEVEGVFDAAAADNKDDQPLGEKGVPNFWLTAMKNNEVLAEEISERDEGALHYLKDVTWSRIDGSKGFKLAFIFNSNPYFKNSMLTKEYHMINEAEHILEKAIGTEIEWFPGKCLTQKILKKKPKKGSKNSQPITKTEDCESFFNFFSPPQVPEDEDDDVDEEAAELLQNHMEQDYDIGSTLKDKIIPHAVSWFTGEAAQYDEDEETEDDEEDDDEEEDDDAEENDEVDNEEDKGMEMIARKDGSMQTSE